MDDNSATEARFWKEQRHRARSLGFGGTVEGLALIGKRENALAAALKRELDTPSIGWERQFKAFLRRIEPQRVAGVTLWSTVTAIVNNPGDAVAIKLQIGDAVRTEIDLDRLATARPGTHKVIVREMAESPDVRAKRRRAEHWAARAGFEWSSSEADLRSATWLWALCLKTLGNLFTEDQHCPALRGEAVDEAVAIAMAHMRNHPVFGLRSKPPTDWTTLRNGGYWTSKDKLFAPFVRNIRSDEDEAMYRGAIRRGEMDRHMAGVSALQRIEWMPNWRIIEMLGHIEGMGLLKADAKGIGKRKRQEKANRSRLNAAAQEIIPQWRFYTARNCDTRGRVYSITHFGLEREDLVRSLFLFANGKPIGEDGMRWLKIHAANCYGIKGSFEARVQWVDEHVDQIRACAADPLADQWWTSADEKSRLTFLAACFELAGALEQGETFQTRLPIAFDGTANGFQHLLAMAGAPEAAFVNLVPLDQPNDLYQIIADRVAERLRASNDPLAKACLEYGVDRKLLKPCVMTFPYSVTPSGMRRQLEDGIRERGMKPDRAAVMYLIKHLKEAIRDVAPNAVKVQEYLRDIAGVLAKVGLPVRWSSPTGFVVCNRAHKRKIKTVDMMVHIEQIGLRYQHRLAEDEAALSESRMRNCISPNFTHSMDASHMIRVANACTAAAINDFAVIHDSYICRAPDAENFRAIVLREFATLYQQNNVLADLRERAESDIASNKVAAAIFQKKKLKLPDSPLPGSLNLADIRHAQYAFA